MEKMTFAQYIETKQQLRQAVKETPMQEVEYSIRKYCKIPLGETKDDKQYISLKPKQTMVVKWLYEDVSNPTPVGISFIDSDSDEEYQTFWSGEKMEKWLTRNAREKFNV